MLPRIFKRATAACLEHESWKLARISSGRTASGRACSRVHLVLSMSFATPPRARGIRERVVGRAVTQNELDE